MPRADVAKAIASQIERIDYTNFKASVVDIDRQMAYLAVWRRSRS